MDKVIDGVDVSGCEFSCENPLHEIKHSCNVRGYEKDNGLHIHLKCKDNPNCYYKQLKRLQAENKKLKYYLNKIREDELNSMDVEWDEYITECTSTEYTNVITFVELALGKEMNKCIKGESCLHCDTDYCRFKDEVAELKAECERLKEENKRVNVLLQKACKEVEWVRNKYADNYSELKAENERLKEENKQLKKLKFKSDGIELLQDANLNLHNANVKYRQALQEIRDIAKEQLQDVSDRCINTTPMYIVHKHILDKINEVIGAE